MQLLLILMTIFLIFTFFNYKYYLNSIINIYMYIFIMCTISFSSCLDYSKYMYIYYNFSINYCFYSKLIQYFNNSWLNFIGILLTFLILFIFYKNSNHSINTILNKNQRVYKKFFFLITILIVCIFLENNFSYKFNLKELTSTTTSINTALLNTLVVVHPFFTHILYGALFILLSLNYSFNSIFLIKVKSINLIFLINTIFFFFKKIFQVLFSVSSFVLILGGWWASQELVWNNWWSWDFIEMMSLLFTFLILELLHFFKKNAIFKNLRSAYLTIPIYVIFFFFFIRYDLSVSLHSFNLFELSEFFFLQILVLFIAILFIFFFKKIKYLVFFNFFEEARIAYYNYNFFVYFFFKFIVASILLFCTDVLINISTAFNLKNELIYLYSSNYKCIFITILIFLFLWNLKISYILIFVFMYKSIFYKVIELICFFSSMFLISKNFNKKSISRLLIIILHALILVLVLVLDYNFIIYTYFYEWLAPFYKLAGYKNLFFLKKDLSYFYKIDAFNEVNYFGNAILNYYSFYLNNSFIFNFRLFDHDYLSNSWVELIFNFFIKSSPMQVITINSIFNEKNILVFPPSLLPLYINSFFFLLLYICYFNKKTYDLKV